MTSVTNIHDTVVDMDIHGAGMEQAMSRFQKLRSLAHQIETEPCLICCETEHDSSNTVIHAQFDFCCAAEKIIFQLNCAFNSRYHYSH